MSVSISSEIFKAYDIRGLCGEQIDGGIAERIGRAFAQVLADLAGKPVGELRIGLGRDMRLTAPELSARYREGMLGAGASVIDAGQVGSEMLYFLVGSRELDGGLMCTASHNPKAYTGAKLVREGAIALSGDSGIQDVRRLVEAESTGDGEGPADGEPRGSLEEVDLYEEFQTAALRFIDPEVITSAPRPLKVVVDGGNGMAGPMVGPLLESLELELIETYWTPDGNFPDHEPNPLLPENRKLIIERVRETGADLGIAWDGDADRCFFIDETGAFVDGDFLTALLAESLLRKSPGEAILYDVRASRAVPDTVTAAGGTPFINRVGHAFFKTRMRKEGSLFGGEVSGHYYFRDFYCADSGTIPALLVLELLCSEGESMSQLLAPYHERYFISGEVNSEVADPLAKIEEIAERYPDAE
jgi:phosphomannomutase